MNFKNKQEKLEFWHAELLKLVEERGHILVSGKMQYHQREKCYLIYCSEHDLEKLTTYYNYKKSRTGCLLCGRKQVSKKLTERTFSSETIEKMKTSAKQRPGRDGKPRRWRETYDYRVWKASVCEL